MIVIAQLFHDGGCYIETSPNQWTGFYMITAFVIKELKEPSIRKERNQAQNENDFSKLLLNPFQI